MTQQKLLIQRIIYIGLIAAFLVCLFILGRPSQLLSDGTTGNGGILAQERSEAGLSEANLGKIDPAGSAMKLATFGMRGVAVSLLWHRSQEYEKRADWDNVVATANQIITLEPHFITIWDFVGWQLAYNASAMFDDYRERYRWVIRGFEFVQDGTVYNNRAPKLYVRTGWTISQKVGIADEKKQYRRLFREDDELAARQAAREINTPNRDNWLLGQKFYQRAIVLYEDFNGDIGKETRLLFYGRAPMNSIRYAEWMSIDGCGLSKDGQPLFDVENCEKAWIKAEEDWNEYSQKYVETTIEDRKNPGTYRWTSLNVQKESLAQIKDYESQLISFIPDDLYGPAPEGEDRESWIRKSIVWDRWNSELTDELRASAYPKLLNPHPADDYNLGAADFPFRTVREFLDGKFGAQPEWENWRENLAAKRLSYVEEDLRDVAQRPPLLLTNDEDKDYGRAWELVNDWQNKASNMLKITPEILASKASSDKSAEAQDIIAEIQKQQEEERFSRMMREIMGADFHEAEVVFEQTEEARSARQHRQAVRDMYYSARFEEANSEFLKCFESWSKLLAKDEKLRNMPQMQTELFDEVEKYVIVLEQLEEAFPETYPLQNEVVRTNDLISGRLREANEATAYIEKELNEGKVREARNDAEKVLLAWTDFNEGNPMYELGPLPEATQSVFDSCRLWVRASEELNQTSFDSASFNNYPGKLFIEFMIQKRNPDYQEIEKLENERLNNPDKKFEILEKEIALWAKIVEIAPVLKYDQTSDLNARIQDAIQNYQLELKSRNQPVPDDFPLKNFPSPTGA